MGHASAAEAGVISFWRWGAHRQRRRPQGAAITAKGGQERMRSEKVSNYPLYSSKRQRRRRVIILRGGGLCLRGGRRLSGAGTIPGDRVGGAFRRLARSTALSRFPMKSANHLPTRSCRETTAARRCSNQGVFDRERALAQVSSVFPDELIHLSARKPKCSSLPSTVRRLQRGRRVVAHPARARGGRQELGPSLELKNPGADRFIDASPSRVQGKTTSESAGAGRPSDSSDQSRRRRARRAASNRATDVGAGGSAVKMAQIRRRPLSTINDCGSARTRFSAY